MKKLRIDKHIMSLSLSVLLAVFLPAVVYSVPYIITDLGTGTALSINGSAQVVGTSGTDAILWEYDWSTDVVTMTTLGPGGANDINDLGQIVGNSGGSGFLWESGIMSGLSLQTAHGINNNGDIAGSYDFVELYNYYNAALWIADSLTNLGTPEAGTDTAPAQSTAYVINDNGKIAGSYGVSYPAEFWTGSFRWSATGGIEDIGAGFAEGAYGANAINNSGEIAGTGRNPARGWSTQHAFFWTEASGSAFLPALYSHPGLYGNSEALGINDAGVIVGWSYGISSASSFQFNTLSGTPLDEAADDIAPDVGFWFVTAQSGADFVIDGDGSDPGWAAAAAFVDPANDVLPGTFPTPTNDSGYDVVEVRAYMDIPTLDIYLLLKTLGVPGDTDGDGNPDSGSVLPDFPGVSGPEIYQIRFDCDQNGVVDHWIYITNNAGLVLIIDETTGVPIGSPSVIPAGDLAIGDGSDVDHKVIELKINSSEVCPALITEQAVLWTGSGIQGLGDLIPTGSEWDGLTIAYDINNSGQIVGEGTISGVEHAFLLSPDADGDGYWNGEDCDDSNPSVHPGAIEEADSTCSDGLDNDCDGLGDCTDTADCSTDPVCLACTPPGTDTDCDGADDDCDGAEDEDYVSEGTTCGIGACASTGFTSCVGGAVQDSCTEGIPAADDATCDGSDDDCSGTEDEDYVSEGTTCGIGACASTGFTSCVGGAVQDSCTEGIPATDDATCDGEDDDCDTVSDEDYASISTSCGTGACAATGSTSCVGGAVQDSCAEGIPAANDATCDGVDDDCDNEIDEDCPTIGYSPVSFTFRATEGGSDPLDQTLNISNAGGGILDWSVSKTQNWLALDPLQGIDAGTVTVSVNITTGTGLTAGSYTDTITITDSNDSNSSVSVTVSLTVNPPSGDPWDCTDDTDCDGIENDVENNVLHTNPSMKTLFVRPKQLVGPGDYDYWPGFIALFPSTRPGFADLPPLANAGIEVMVIGDPANPYEPMRDFYYDPSDPDPGSSQKIPCDILEVVRMLDTSYYSGAGNTNNGHTWFNERDGNCPPDSSDPCNPATWSWDIKGRTDAGSISHGYPTPKVYPFAHNNYLNEGTYLSIAEPPPDQSPQGGACSSCLVRSCKSPYCYDFSHLSPMNLNMDGTVEFNGIVFDAATGVITAVGAMGTEYTSDDVYRRTLVHEIGHALIEFDLDQCILDNPGNPEVCLEHCLVAGCLMYAGVANWDLSDFGGGGCVEHKAGGPKDVRIGVHNTVH